MVNMSELTHRQIQELAFGDSERRELENARQQQIVFDAECPETTPERAKKFRRVNPPRMRDAKKQRA